jgi:hypothetical protein
VLSPAERRTLAEIERQLAAEEPAAARGARGRGLPDRAVLAARILIAVLAVTGVVAGLVVARLDIVLACVLTVVAVEALFRRSV